MGHASEFTMTTAPTTGPPLRSLHLTQGNREDIPRGANANLMANGSLLCCICGSQGFLNLGQLKKRGRIFRTDRSIVFAPWVRPLQRAAHGERDRYRVASVGGRTYKIKLRARSHMTGEAVSAKPVHDRHETTRANR
jgi:hypothetical protein